MKEAEKELLVDLLSYAEEELGHSDGTMSINDTPANRIIAAAAYEIADDDLSLEKLSDSTIEVDPAILAGYFAKILSEVER